jgi:hypothetical protein
MSDEAMASKALEERLRSALHGAAGSVSPEVLPGLEERIRQGFQSAGRPAGRRWRFIAPVMAASAVAAVALVAALLVPGHDRHQGSGGMTPGTLPQPAPAHEPRFVIINNNPPLKVRDAATGALVAHVKVPYIRLIVPDPHTRRHFQIDWLATPNGRTYVVGLYRAIPCTSRFYQFTLGPHGKPGPVTPFTPLPVIRGAGVGDVAFSANGRMLAFSTISGSPACAYKLTSSHIGVVNLVTGKTKQWSGAGGSLSLDYSGKLLTYSTGKHVMAIPTTSPPGPAGAHSRILVTARKYGRYAQISFAAITPDGKHVYFNVFPERGGPGPGQIRVAAVGSSRSRVVASKTQYNGLMFADPRVRHLLLYIHNELVKLDLRSGKVAVQTGPLRKFIGEVFW